MGGFSNIQAFVISLALRVVPAREHVFIHAIPATEGNAVELVRALIKHTDRMLVWPAAPPREYLESLGIPTVRIRRLSTTRSMSAVWAFVRARAVFQTHGIYGVPVPAPGRPIVNVWHGDSFKGGRLFPDRTLRGPSSTYIVSCSRLIGDIKAHLAGVPSTSVLLTSNPRVSQMFSPPSNDQLISLGIDPHRPFVMWMPTFRVARNAEGGVAWSNTVDPDSDAGLTREAAAIASRLASANISLVIKPHWLDHESRATPGAIILDDEQLQRHGVPLYGLLGASAGLISDYSSVWIDYLALDRTIGFLINDLKDFRGAREVTAPELIEQYPGETLETVEGLERFIDDLRSNGSQGRPRREHFKKLIGYTTDGNAAEFIVRTALK